MPFACFLTYTSNAEIYQIITSKYSLFPRQMHPKQFVPDTVCFLYNMYGYNLSRYNLCRSVPTPFGHEALVVWDCEKTADVYLYLIFSSSFPWVWISQWYFRFDKIMDVLDIIFMILITFVANLLNHFLRICFRKVSIVFVINFL